MLLQSHTTAMNVQCARVQSMGVLVYLLSTEYDAATHAQCSSYEAYYKNIENSMRVVAQ